MPSYSQDVEYKTYLFRYRHDGAEWGLEIVARDQKDAKARLAKLPYATLDGELVARVPATLGPLAAISAALRNAAFQLFRPVIRLTNQNNVR